MIAIAVVAVVVTAAVVVVVVVAIVNGSGKEEISGFAPSEM